MNVESGPSPFGPNERNAYIYLFHLFIDVYVYVSSCSLRKTLNDDNDFERRK